MADNANERPIIIKKIKKSGGGHHGGAWKVAYADFVTAMMAFFLLLWLLSSTSKAQKEGLAEYFTFAQVSQSTSGGNGMLAGASLSSGQGIGEGSPSVTFQLAAPEPPTADADSDSRPTGPPSFDSDFAEVAQDQTTDTVTDETIN
ncbi:MAG TPA: chemotaxis protein MotB, partial [Alphaproteobacteria bacterium]|nr:chemotaxis protein MotB [Alphaproteobacteria bacterium]